MNMGLLLAQRFKRLGDREDLQRAIDATENSAAAISPEHLLRPMVLDNVVRLLGARFRRLGRYHLKKSIHPREEAIAITSHDDPVDHLGYSA